MKVSAVLAPGLDVSSLQKVTCKAQNEEWQPAAPLSPLEREGHDHCGRIKYHVEHRGPFRIGREVLQRAPDVVKSQEWFGSGALAFRLVIVSRRFRQAVVAASFRGLDFEPIQLGLRDT